MGRKRNVCAPVKTDSRIKVSKEDHVKILSRCRAGETMKDIAKEYGVATSTIYRICTEVLKIQKTKEFHAGRPRY